MPSPHRRRRRRSSHSRSYLDPATTQSQPVDTAGLWLSIAGIYWVMFVLAMHAPSYAIPPELRPSEGADGVLHCLAYFGFAFLVCRAFDAMHRRRYPAVNPPVLIYLFVFFACITYGYIDEETQPLTGRTADSADWEADVLGSLFGVCTHLFLSVFFTSDPAQAWVQRMELRRRRHRRSHRHRSGSGSSSGDMEHQHDDGHHRRRRRRRRRSTESHDGHGDIDGPQNIDRLEIDDRSTIDRQGEAPPLEVPPPEPPPSEPPKPSADDELGGS